MKAKISAIVDAIEFMDQYSECFLDKKTGKIEWVSDMAMTSEEKDEVYDRLDEHGFYRLPTSFEIRDYDIMEAFVHTKEGNTRKKLESAISGKGAFRRFKDTVYNLGFDHEWYDFREAIYKLRAARWCKENGIEYEE